MFVEQLKLLSKYLPQRCVCVKITQKWNSVQKAWIAIAWIILISTSWYTGQTYEPSERPTPEYMTWGKWIAPKGQL